METDPKGSVVLCVEPSTSRAMATLLPVPGWAIRSLVCVPRRRYPTAFGSLSSNIVHRRNLHMQTAGLVTAARGTGTLSKSIGAYFEHLFGRAPQFPLALAPFRAAATTSQELDSWRRRLTGRADYAVCAGRRTRTFPLRASTCARPGVERGLVWVLAYSHLPIPPSSHKSRRIA